MQDGDEGRVGEGRGSAAEADAADTAPMSFPPANCPRHREYLQRRAEDGLNVAGVCLTQLLDAAEREQGGDAELRRATALTVAAAKVLAQRR